VRGLGRPNPFFDERTGRGGSGNLDRTIGGVSA
jgi:hypothetical protein